jgi:hypothetical protein
MEARAHLTRHSGRTLAAHLMGTAALLDRAGYPQRVVLGGLFHSIYGTNAFKKKSLPLSRREKVKAVIGPEAERLACLFCSIDRPKAIREAMSDLRRWGGAVGTFVSVRTSARARLPLRFQTIEDLAAIEVANLIEQGSYRDYPEFSEIAARIRAAA